MIKKTFVLLRAQMLGFFGLNKLRYGGSKKQKWSAALMGLLFALLVLMLIGYSALVAFGMVAVGAGDGIAPMVLAICAAITFVFTFMKSNGVLFAFKDYDTVMALPVSNAAVIASRLLSVYLGNLLFSAMVAVSAMVVRGALESPGVAFWIYGLLGLLFAPLLPMIGAMILGALIAAISARFKRTNAVSIGLSLVFTVGILVASFSFQNVDIAGLEQFGQNIGEAIGRVYPPALFYARAANGGDLVSFLVYAAMSIVPAALFVLVLARFYARINSALFARHARSNYKLGALDAASPYRALLKKELRRVFSSTLYLLNTLIGGVLIVVAGVALLFVDVSNMEAALELPAGSMHTYLALVPIIVAMFTIMGSVSSVSMNMEGKSLWVLCSLPVAPKTVYDAKIGANLVLMGPLVALGGALIAVGLRLPAALALLTVALPLGYTLFTAVAGMRLNVRYPRYDWTTEQQAVKQSASLGLTMLAGFVAVLVPLALCVVFSAYAVWIEFASLALILALSWALYRPLRNKKLYVV